MPISGLLITLADDPHASETAISTLKADRRIDVGQRRGPYLPVVADTAGTQQNKRLWHEFSELPGIINVNLVFADLDDSTESNRHGDQ